MILTLCTACAAPLPDEPSDAVQCAECATRYCSERCERYDRRRGGHGKICGAIASGGGAEQYNADKKYAEAVAEAVEECTDDTEGQTCYICLEGDSEEGLVRMCACRGGAGFAHVSCLARQAKILVAEAEERDLDDDAFEARWVRWYTCRLCEQQYHGVMRCALSWACWKTYVGRPEADDTRSLAINQLGNGLDDAKHYADALCVREADLAMMRRLGASEEDMLVVQGNIANSYHMLGREEEALQMRRDVYSGWLELFGEEHEDTLREASNYAATLKDLRRFEEAKEVLRKMIPVARRVLGASHINTLRVRWIYAQTLYKDDAVTLDDLREAVSTLEEIEPTAQRVLGPTNPTTAGIEESLQDARVVENARVRSAAADALMGDGAKLIVLYPPPTPSRKLRLNRHYAPAHQDLVLLATIE